MTNKYCKHSKISETTCRLILRYFAEDCAVADITPLTGISRPAVISIVEKIRKKMLLWLENEQPFSGEVEVDESYFGPRRIRGKRSRGARKKMLVLGMLKRGGNVYTQVIPRANKESILPILREKVLDETTIHTDGWTSYDGLIDVKNVKHYRVYHSKDEFVRGKSHINGIESFWSFCTRWMRKQNGVRKTRFLIHLKECEWRWNHRNDNIYQILLKKLRENPL